MELENRINQLLIIARYYIEKQQYDRAFEGLDRILELTPNHHTALQFKAEIYNHLNDYKQAEECSLQVLRHHPDNVAILAKLWSCYFQQKRYSDIFESAVKLIRKNPKDIYALRACGVALAEMDRGEEAIELLKRAEAEGPRYIPITRILANLYFKLNKLQEAGEYLNIVHEAEPNDAEVLANLCDVLGKLLQNDDQDYTTKADQLANKLVNIAKDDMSSYFNIQKIALTSIDLDLQAKLGDKKDLLDYWANNMLNRAFVLQKSRVETMQDRFNLLEAHKVWGAKIEASVDKSEIKHRVRQRVSNKVRLGIASYDFRSNHIGCYIWPLVEGLDRDKFEVYCYGQWPDSSDPMQHKFEGIADGFKECPLNMSDKEIAQVIADDCVDVLIETGAWYHRPKTIAYRPAPLQISWLDYLHSMGEPTAVDYIVIDPYVKPESAQLLLEKPIVLPEVWMVMHPYGFPPVPITQSTPEDRNGYITFGAMNATYRLTEEIFRVWAGIMKMVPNSRFLYIHPEFSARIVQGNFYKYMKKYGISEDRISFIATRENFLEHFNKVDIALDPFPHMGNTTTCYTLWMGLPLVTLVGPCFFERVSYSALSNCGLSDLCAFSLQEYHDIALALVADKERRRHIRHNLRGWILNGPLGQTKRFADNMGDAIANVLGR